MKKTLNGLETIDYILIVDSNLISNLLIEKKIKESGFSGEVKMSLNGGHALLYLDHLHLSEKMKGANLLILLNIKMPIMDGLEFLQKYNNLKTLPKENIMIAVFQDDLSVEKAEKAKKSGVTYFLPRAFSINYLNEMVTNYFSEIAKSEIADRSEVIERQTLEGFTLTVQAAAGF